MHTNKSLLIVGGAGYLGSHMVALLERSGYSPIVLDNLSTGHRESVKANLIEGDIADSKLLDDLFSTHGFSAVMHFASFIQVDESIKNPEKYYTNNVAGTLNLLCAMQRWNVNKIIFSSTAAVYGEPLFIPISEDHPVAPINPYGQSKRMIEVMLEDFSRAYDFQYASLRYFNAAGADVDSGLCENHNPETHLIPLVLQTALQKRGAVTVYGRDYPTFDGTCVRDYIHVMDLCWAHLYALQTLLDGKKRGIYNLGSGVGYSVQQVIEMVKTITGRDFRVIYADRRLGDPAILVADPSRALQELQWHPMHSDLKTIIEHAYQAMLLREPMESMSAQIVN